MPTILACPSSCSNDGSSNATHSRDGKLCWEKGLLGQNVRGCLRLLCLFFSISVAACLLSQGDVESNPGPPEYYVMMLNGYTGKLPFLCISPCAVDLVLANLPKLCNLLADASPEWMDLGLQLGVDQATLRIIRQDNHHVIEDCFTDMLSEWLKMIDPLPSWEGLIAALESPSVNQKDLASVVMNELGIPVETEDAQGKGKHA